MTNVDDAKKILEELGMPARQQSILCCYTLLAMAGIGQKDKWKNASNNWIRIHEIIEFIKINFQVEYAENSRETFRKQALHHFRTAALIEDNGKATNSPQYRYRITEETLNLITTYKSDKWKKCLMSFKKSHESLIDIYASKKRIQKVPILVNGINLDFSIGEHNELQKAIIEEFAPRFAPGCMCLYVGDSSTRDLVKNDKKLRELGFDITLHDKMPDVVLYCEDKDWLYFIEAVCSVGPMSPERIMEIKSMTEKTKSGKIYVTAFPDFKTYKRFSENLAWETEIWIADAPDHMIHLNGDRFMGPR